MTHYESLGVARDASAAEIKRAYRQKASELHPDRNQDEGSHEAMQAVQAAYECLSDPVLRAAYDAGESVANVDLDHEANLVLETMFGNAIDSGCMDAIDAVRQRLLFGDAHMLESLDKNRAAEKKLVRWHGRIVRKVDGPNIAEAVLEKKLKEVRVSIARLESSKRLGRLALDMLAGYVDNGPPLDEGVRMIHFWAQT